MTLAAVISEKSVRVGLSAWLLLTVFIAPALGQDEKKIRVGVPTILSGDLAVLGQNIERTVRSYEKRYLRHPIAFVVEDARKSSLDGLRAYQRLINVEKVHMIIGGTSSNGTIAGAPLVNTSKTVLITPLTGGSNIDKAGPFVFRIGNSDVLNGYQQADILIEQGVRRVALFTELTEYTQDIAKFFRERFTEKGGSIVFDEDFPPDLDSFKSHITKMNGRNPEALVMATQTGLAFGIFLRELQELKGLPPSRIHTNFVAASNPDAHTAAGPAIIGVNYLAPRYDADNPKLKKFFLEYREDHGVDPAIPFHTAGTFDALEMLQSFLDREPAFDRERFQRFLSTEIKNYRGLMGVYSFDSEGNADLGFLPAVIE
ncbi:MAG: ABC transporter substrate-binding protein [Bdellovibrionota bacterium]|nr:MAG: ABC transporter substrate-binding protein [Bdellovibrionota bacterium]